MNRRWVVTDEDAIDGEPRREPHSNRRYRSRAFGAHPYPLAAKASQFPTGCGRRSRCECPRTGINRIRYLDHARLPIARGPDRCSHRRHTDSRPSRDRSVVLGARQTLLRRKAPRPIGSPCRHPGPGSPAASGDTAGRACRTVQRGLVRRPTIDGRRPLSIRSSHFILYRRSTDIGVVFDLMIHDLDLALSMIASPVVEVAATGQALLGTHEDWAEVRLAFQNGAVANLYASRVSRTAVRRMSLVGANLTAEIDFARSTCEVIEACEEVRNGTFDANQMPAEQRLTIGSQLFERWLPTRTIEAPAVNAIERELDDFARSITDKKLPLVDGGAARDAIHVAERILEAIARSSETRRAALERDDPRPSFRLPIALAIEKRPKRFRVERPKHATLKTIVSGCDPCRASHGKRVRLNPVRGVSKLLR